MKRGSNPLRRALFLSIVAASIGRSATLAQDKRPADAATTKIAVHALTDATLSDLDAQIDKSLPRWLAMYKTCHEHPELSLQEKESSRRVAQAFRDAGLNVATEIGGHGVVGVLANGPGPVLLIRSDLDALPIIEETGLPFASKVKVELGDGSHVGVMHACGHDVHQTILSAAATALAALKNRWSGAVVFIAQPAEELGRGAEAMIRAGLFEKFPKPQACIALHVSHMLKTGTVGYASGWVYANVDSVDITIHGRGGHGAYPHATVDPIVAAAQTILALQTIVSRRVNPLDHAVVTVGSIHAGTKHNVIPADAKLELTVRSYTDEVRRQVLDAIRQIATDTAKAAGCETPPDVTVIQGEFTPASYNDPDLTADAAKTFRRLFGEQNVVEHPPSMGGEDFSRYYRTLKVPGMMFQLGVVDDARFAASKSPGSDPLPTVHSSKFRVDPEPTLRTGIKAMTGLALAILQGR